MTWFFRHVGNVVRKRQAAVVQEMAVMQRKKSWLFLLTLLLIVLLGRHLWWRGRGGSKVIWFKVRNIEFPWYAAMIERMQTLKIALNLNLLVIVCIC